MAQTTLGNSKDGANFKSGMLASLGLFFLQYTGKIWQDLKGFGELGEI